MSAKEKEIVQQMVSAGLHLGHRRRNPKMIPYIYSEKDGLQIINLLQTYLYLKKASLFLYKMSRRGKSILFVGTTKYISKCIKQIADECNSWYINNRWLGGLLTNWKTMNKSKAQTKLRMRTIIKRTQTKKELAQIERHNKRFYKCFGGIQTMTKPPDIVIIVGQKKEMNAVRECQKLEIKCLTILDANCDPNLTDVFIPANDDSLTSINFILKKLSRAIQKGRIERKL
uniref:Small ribosomal subunit protein uS2c n=1 Tax=Glaukea argentea TaxID=2894057 RepID=A0A386B1K0_9CHLO|nr:ribosomal protein S2 [Udotea argentea]AYC65570.1 ribosomal protein S2 [Udotea argentea]